MKNLRQRRIWDRILLCSAVLLLTVGAVGLCLFPAPRFSAVENRYLAEFPTLTTAGAINGSYARSVDSYAAERLPLRLSLRQARALCKLAEGNPEVGGVLLCRDGSLSRRITVNERAYGQNLAALQRLVAFSASKGLPVTVAAAPCRIDARAEVLPRLYHAEGSEVVAQLRRALPEIIAFEKLTADAHWYRTDHHWSTHGAYQAYLTLADALGYRPYSADSFRVEVVKQDFYGTSHSAAGIPFITPDSIALYRYAEDMSFSLLLNGKQAPFGGFYDFSKLSDKDGYAVFFGGNYGHLEISDGTARETLLVIKDSFANALLPFLARHYHILAVDPRYTDIALTELAPQADRILVLCGVQTLCESAVFRTLTAGI
ncbi:MAG: hypothetical protein IKM08_06395 [Clostridia bacterium]|nr:hypothetical protein [Clostridia bacterium]